MGRYLPSCVLPLLALVCRSEEATPTRFPLAAGNTWIYRGLVQWTEANNQVQSREIQWPVKVLGVVKRKGQVIALLRGWPTDLAWFDPTKGPGTHVLVQDSAGLALISGEAAQRVWEAVQPKRSETPPAPEQDQAERWLPDRLKAGMAWGEPEDLARPDGLYVRRVEEVGTQGLDGLGGWVGPRRGPFFRIAYRTNPDHTVMDFVPGLGFTRYTYAHHGTVSGCDLKLVAVEFPKVAPKHP